MITMSVEGFTVVARTFDMVSTDSERCLVGVFSPIARARTGIDLWIAAHEYGCAPLYDHMYVYFGELDAVAEIGATDEDYIKPLYEGNGGRESRYEDAGGFYLSYRGCELQPRKKYVQPGDGAECILV